MSDVVWITGASSGLGAALARRMARAGNSVALSARSGDKLEEMAGEAGLSAFAVDVQDAEATRAAVSRIEAALGPIDQAVLNAGTDRKSVV